MRRSLFVVLALVGMLLALSAVPALATVHPLVCSENSAAAANGTPADTQDPPGITSTGLYPGPDNSSALHAQPVHAVLDAAVNSGGASLSSFKAPGCP